MGASVFGIALFVLIASVVVAAVAVVLVGAVVRWRDRIRQPCCGSCRYPVAGLTAMTCPECGSDLWEVGIMVPGVRPRRRVHVAEVIAAWAVTAVGCAVITTVLAGSSPMGQRVSFTRTDVLTPVSASFGSLRAVLSGEVRGNASALASPADRLSVSLQQAAQTPGAPVQLVADFENGTWIGMPAGGFPPGSAFKFSGLPISDADVSGWLQAVGETGAASAPSGEIAALTAYLNSGGTVVNNAALSSATAGVSLSSGPTRWVIATMAAVWLAIFAVGCALIVMWTRARPKAELGGDKTGRGGVGVISRARFPVLRAGRATAPQTHPSAAGRSRHQ